MAIFVRTSPEPWTDNSWRPDNRPILAESDTYRLLRQEMERYTRRELHGRSYLVAGHRGSGKTTLVLKAIQDVVLELRTEGFRPLLVRIQGPELLSRAPAVSPEKGTNGQTTSGQSANGQVTNGSRQAVGGAEGAAPSPEASGVAASEAAGRVKDEADARAKHPSSHNLEAEAALQRVTLAIYRALCAEVGRLYRRSALRDIGKSKEAAELAELAAQLVLTLDSAPSVAELREYWRRIGRIEEGVFFDPNVAPDNQGLRELVALASASQAYRKVLGKEKLELKNTSAQRDASEHSQRLKAGSGELVKAVSSLAAAGSAGAGVAAGSPMAGLAVAVLALFSGWSFEWQRSRSRSRSRDEQYVFIVDKSLGTLERELPTLVERLRDARLAPIFVVDELDKVDGLAQAMQQVVNHLKQFVAEGAFFCFLTDRDYYETLRHRFEDRPYPKEYTYFHDRLLIGYRPEDLRAYLRQVLGIESTADEADREVLTYVLLHRACLHAVDLRREVRRLPRVVTDAARLSYQPGYLRSNRRFGLEVVVQIAVEAVLAGKDVQGRLEANPGFLQLANDAVYFPSRRWRSAEPEIDASYEAFRAYLAERMQPNEPEGATERVGRKRGAADRPDAAAPAERRVEEGRREIPNHEIPDREIPDDEIPAEEIPDDEIPAEEIPVEEIPVQEIALPEGDIRELHEMALEVIGLLCDLQALRSLVPDRLPDLRKDVLDLVDGLESSFGSEARGSEDVTWALLRPSRPAGSKDAGPTSFRWLYDSFGRSKMDGKRVSEPGISAPSPAPEVSPAPDTPPAPPAPEGLPEILAEEPAAEDGVGGIRTDEEPSVAEEGIEASSAPAPSPAPPAEEAGKEAGSRDWVTIRDRVVGVDRALFGRTERLDLEAMGSELGLLASSPSWLSIEPALDRLSENQGQVYLGRADDERIAGVYIEMLKERLPLVRKALYYVILAVASIPDGQGGKNRSLLDRGLRHFARLGRFRSEKGGSRMLQGHLKAFERSVPGEILAPWQDGIADLLATEPWTDGLDREVDLRVEHVPPFGKEFGEAWKLWSNRLKRFLLRGQQDFDPTWADLVCGVAGMPPTELAVQPLGSLGLRFWSERVRRTTGLDPDPPSEPLWMRAAALARLGLGTAEDLLNDPYLDRGWEPQDMDAGWRPNDVEEYEDWRDWVRRSVPAREKGQALLLHEGDRALSAEWPLSDVYGCLAADRYDDLDSLVSMGAERFFLNPQAPPRILLIEVRDEKELDQARYASRILSADGKTIFLLPEGFVGKTLRDLPIVVAPRSLDDAIERGLERLAPALP